MRKIVRLLLLLSLCIVMVGCSKKDIKSVSNEDQSSDSTTNQSEDETEEVQVTLAPTEVPVETVDSIETEESTSGTKPSIESLSDDVYSFQVELDGDVYQFPMTFEDLIAYGWEYDGDDTQTINPDQYSVGEVFKKGDITIYAEIINLGTDVEPFNKCVIGGFNIDDYLVGEQDIIIMLPGGIQFAKSTKEEIIAAYGEPTSTYDGELYTTLTYEYASYQDIEINVDIETKVINSISLSNYVAIEGTTTNESEVSSEVPEIVTKYIAPTSLGKDFEKFIVEYGGDLYQIPAPVSEFEKNGWKIIAEESDVAIKAKDFGWVTIMKNNQKLKVIVNNYADSATTIKNCFVTSVKGDDNSTNIDITIQNQITRGMTQKDLEKALTGVDFEKDDSSSTFTYYTIEGPDSSLDTIEILIRNDTSVVQAIELSNQPKADKLFKN